MNPRNNESSIGCNNHINNNENETTVLITYTKKTKKSNKKTLRKYIPIIILFLLYIIIQKIGGNVDYEEDEDEDGCYKPDNKSIYYEEKFDSIQEAFDKSKDFINNNINGVLINTEKVELPKKPKVSVVIPCCNCSKYILRSIRSIQNQNLSNFEIIISNDASDNNTLTIIKQLQKEENRIRIINNKINMGLLYTRSIGTLSAKGKYIFPLDSDDMILDQDVLSVLTKIAYKGNFDIIIFNSIYTDLKPDVNTTKIGATIYESSHKPNRVMFQPDLGIYIYNAKDKIDDLDINDFLIHGKFIKTKIYQKALNKLGMERYSRFIISGEDDISCNIVFNTAQSAKIIAKYGYLYINNDGSTSKRQKDEAKTTRALLFILDSLIDFSLDLPKNKKVLVHFILFLFKRAYIQKVLSIENNNKVLISCLDRILNSSYISDELKNEIRIRGKKLNFIKYNFTKFN